MDSLSLPTRIWLLSLYVAQGFGCPAPAYLFGSLEHFVDRDGVKLDPAYWVGTLWPQVNSVRDEFLEGLLSALTLACEQLRDDQLNDSFYIVGSSDAVLRKGAIGPEGITGLEAVRDWCLQGAFRVEWSPDIQILYR